MSSIANLADTSRAAPPIWAYAALAGAGAFFGLGFVFGKWALADMPVHAMVTFRFVIASVILAPFVFRKRIPLRPRDLAFFALAGVIFVPIQFLIQFEGLARTSVMHASLMVALLPVLIALGSILVPGKRSRPQWIPIGVSALGAILVVAGPSSHSSALGDGLVLLSLFAAVVWVLLCERYINRYDAIAASTYMLWIGTAVLLALELLLHPHQLVQRYSAISWLATCGAGVVSTAAATLFWNIGLSRVASSDAGVFLNLEPLIGALCGIAFFGDALSWPIVAGAVMVIAGAVVVARR
ncbi:MAG TPA: DMT family transporter [Candidatus Baltobacteraceae bacterium]|nr:DMT family transporter [Candidatus Baltobacteraceae bacterium]